MGDVADMMLDGTLCEVCGVHLVQQPPGHPRRCSSCAKASGRSYVTKEGRVCGPEQLGKKRLLRLRMLKNAGAKGRALSEAPGQSESLRRAGYATVNGEQVFITEAGRAALKAIA